MTQMPDPSQPLKIGTRGSVLALAQAHETRARLMAVHDLPAEAFEIVVIRTTGDRITDRPLKEIGGKGLFTREIEEALSAGRIDIAVHSMKDMPTLQPEGMLIDCLLPREDVRDAFVSPHVDSIQDLPQGAVVGSSSLRRRAQLAHRRPDLHLVEFRGNVQTRLRKLEEGVAVATFLAMAGLRRLDMLHVARGPIDPAEMLPAVAQGAIGIQCRDDDERALRYIDALNHEETFTCVSCERAFLAALDGNCKTPIAGQAQIIDGELRFQGLVASVDGSQIYRSSKVGAPADAEKIGREAGEEIKAEAGIEFFEWLQQQEEPAAVSA